MKTKIIGKRMGEEREGRVLNRLVRITEDGWEYEPDLRHAELIVKELQLEEANAVSTPGEDEKRWEEEENEEPLENEKATRFRKIAARANYLAADRPDIMHSIAQRKF